MLVQKSKIILFPFLFYLTVYFLLPSFGINPTSIKYFYLILFFIFLIGSFMKSGNYIFLIFNMLLFIYLIIKDLYNFEYLFIQSMFIALYPGILSQVDKNYSKLNEDQNQKYNFKLLSFLSLLFLTLLTQNNFLNYEIIDHDVSTSLVIANDIFNGYLPYERVWDDKQPLFYFFNYLILFFVEKNFLYYKIFFDIFIFLNSLLIFNILSIKFRKSLIISFFSSAIYLSMMTPAWANAEYSETMSATFIGYAYFRFLGDDNKKQNNFLVGLFLGISTLINIGSSLFLLGFLLLLVFKHREDIVSRALYMFYGFSSVHILIFLIYFSKNLSEVYLLTLFKIPLSYTSTETFFFYDIRVFFESIYKTSYLLAAIFLILFFYSGSIFNKIVNFKSNNIDKISYIFFVFLSILFFYIAGKGYYHHLIYLIFFVPISIGFVESTNLKILLFVCFFLSINNYLFSTFTNSVSNIKNAETLYSNYPVKNLSNDLVKLLDPDDDILALDKVLILFYTDKLSQTYIVHPTNHNENFILDNFIEYGYLDSDYVQIAISENPEIIVCSVNPEGELYFRINSLEKFICNDKYYTKFKSLQFDQNIFKSSEFYYNNQVNTKILINN